MARRQYSDAEKAEALAVLQANAGNYLLTSRQTGIPESNLRAWEGGRGLHPGIAQQCEGKKRALADELEALAYKCVELLPEKLAAAPAKDVAVVLGISTEKMQLLRNKPTEIHKQDGLTEDERARRIAEILDEARRARTLAVGAGEPAGGAGSATPEQSALH